LLVKNQIVTQNLLASMHFGFW